METKIKYLADTNVWLERLLDQEKSDIVSKLLDVVPLEQIYISDFALHSIGVILSRFIVLDAQDFIDVISNIEKYKLDFDDAYQLTVSQKYDMTIVTFDKNFHHEGIAKMTPEEVLDIYKLK